MWRGTGILKASHATVLMFQDGLSRHPQSLTEKRGRLSRRYKRALRVPLKAVLIGLQRKVLGS